MAARRGVAAASVFVCLLGTPSSAATKATITGGADASGRVYTWTVTNESASPIVEVVFPHYGAAVFAVPDGWSAESTNLVNVGVRDALGECRARVAGGASGITRGGPGRFSMQLGSSATRRGRGVVHVRFADGEELVIAGVVVPVPPGTFDKYMPLIGLGAIAVIALGVRAVSRRRKRGG